MTQWFSSEIRIAGIGQAPEITAMAAGKQALVSSLNPDESNGPLPFLLINMAMTADGKIATANRSCSTFGSKEDMRNLMLLRAGSDAVMAGARTVDSNPVTLGPGTAEYRRRRIENGLAEWNARIVVSGSASILPEAKIFQHTEGPLILLTSGQAPAARIEKLRSLFDEIKICGKERIDFDRALRWLRSQYKLARMVCEGGGELNSALFAAGLVNELHLTICPYIFGGSLAPTITDGQGVETLGQATQLELASSRQSGGELFLLYRVLRSAGDPV